MKKRKESKNLKLSKFKKLRESKVFHFIFSKLKFVLILVIVAAISFTYGKSVGLNTDTSSTSTTVEEVTVEKRDITKTLTASGQIDAAKTEKLSLSDTYKFYTMCVEEGDTLEKGDKILEYTNGTYLKAKYDCVVSSVSLPESGEVAGDENYVEVKGTSKFVVSIDVSENEISSLKKGDEVTMTLGADSSKTYTGKISKISAVATYDSSGSTFPVEITITNDGNIKLGMSVSCEIVIEELKDVVAVPIEAVQIEDDERYVVVIEDGKEENVTVTTGLSDDDYVEITSGLSGGETVKVVTTTKQSTIRSSSDDDSGMHGGNFEPSNMPGGSEKDMPDFSNGNNSK